MQVLDSAACAINFPDTLMIRDLYQFKPERPYSPGGEISGTISAVGEGVEGWQVGDRVVVGPTDYFDEQREEQGDGSGDFLEQAQMEVRERGGRRGPRHLLCAHEKLQVGLG